MHPAKATPTGRVHQCLLIATLLPLCWLWTMVVHELGHVVGALATGGSIERVVLHPLAFSRTDPAENPHPAVFVWAGPIMGVLLPLAAFVSCQAAGLAATYLFRFFAGFCMIANGAYIGVGSLSRIGDAGEMLATGSPAWLLWLFGLLTCPLGLYLWNGLGPSFGVGEDATPINRGHAYIVCGLLLATLVLELVLSPR